MARKPRVRFPSALDHVIVRGNQRQKIFRAVLIFSNCSATDLNALERRKKMHEPTGVMNRLLEHLVEAEPGKVGALQAGFTLLLGGRGSTHGQAIDEV